MEPRRGTVENVTHNRVVQGGEMDADLVSAASMELHFEQRCQIQTGQDVPVGAGFPGIAENDAAASGHTGAAPGVAGDGKSDRAAILFEEALHEGDVDFLDLTLPKGFAELDVRGVVLGDEDDTGSAFVEAMHYAGAEGIATLRETLAAAEEGVDQRAARGAGSSVDGHAGRLVDGDDVGVFVEDVKENGFGFGAEERARLGMDGDELATAESMRALAGTSVDQYQPGRDQLLHTGAA